jgi:hypothetical protein
VLTQRLRIQRFSQIFLLILIAALASSCASTFTYRDIQKDFNNAVQAENIPDPSAIGSISSSPQAGYEDVLKRLDDKYIQSLDPRLKMNAYAMKAVAQWRTGKLSEAKQTADTGLALTNVPPSPRDRMVLLIIRPLVNEQDLRGRYLKLPEPQRLTTNEYQKIYAKDFANIAAALKKAAAQATPDTPDSVLYYVYFQRWRVLQDWDTVISHLWDGKDFHSDETDKIQDGARADAAKALNVNEFQEAINNQEEMIPKGYWLRNYMELKAKQ